MTALKNYAEDDRVMYKGHVFEIERVYPHQYMVYTEDWAEDESLTTAEELC